MIYLLEDFTNCDTTGIVGVWGSLKDVMDYSKTYIETHYPKDDFILLAIYARNLGPGRPIESWSYFHETKNWVHFPGK